MLKRYAHIIAIGTVFIILIIGLLYFSSARYANRKPLNPVTPEKQVERNYNWYIKLSVKQQKSTGYTEETNAPLAANGHRYYIGGAAVHPRYPLQAGGKATVPLLPFGTEIHLYKPVTVLGNELHSLIVIDTGDVNYGLWSQHPYWFDIYWGSTAAFNVKEARKYGAQLVDYYWYEPWK